MIKYWPILNFFSLFESENIFNNTITKDPTTPQMCRYATLWNLSVLRQQWKQDFRNNTFKEINNRTNVLIVWIIV